MNRCTIYVFRFTKGLIGQAFVDLTPTPSPQERGVYYM
jgi:hypothetical protein